MPEPTTAVLGNGPAVLPVVRSLQRAGIGVAEIWYQGSREQAEHCLPNNILNELSVPVFYEVHSDRAILQRLGQCLNVSAVTLAFYTHTIGACVHQAIAVINTHPSLLPHYRGRHPLPWMLINGEQRGGITHHLIDDSIDAGPMIGKAEYAIGPDDDYQCVLDKTFETIERHTGTVVGDYLRGTVQPTPQDHAQASYVCRRRPEDGLIDWSAGSESIRRLVLALGTPLPGAYSYICGKKFIVRRATVVQGAAAYVGRIAGQVALLPEGAVVLTGDSGLRIDSLIDADSGEEWADRLAVNMRFEGPPTGPTESACLCGSGQYESVRV